MTRPTGAALVARLEDVHRAACALYEEACQADRAAYDDLTWALVGERTDQALTTMRDLIEARQA